MGGAEVACNHHVRDIGYEDPSYTRIDGIAHRRLDLENTEVKKKNGEFGQDDCRPGNKILGIDPL